MAAGRLPGAAVGRAFGAAGLAGSAVPAASVFREFRRRTVPISGVAIPGVGLFHMPLGDCQGEVPTAECLLHRLPGLSGLLPARVGFDSVIEDPDCLLQLRIRFVQTGVEVASSLGLVRRGVFSTGLLLYSRATRLQEVVPRTWCSCIPGQL